MRTPRGRATAMLLMVAAFATPSLADAADGVSNAQAALRQIDDNQCDQAVDSINQGMRENEPRAFHIAGLLFQNGFCVTRNVPRALRLYERGASLGDREAARTLALIHARGDGVPQSYVEAGRWYAVMRNEPAGNEAAGLPEATIRTYIEAVKDLAFELIEYPKDAVEKGVTGTVKVRFDPRFARVTLLGSTDNLGTNATTEPNRNDFARALLTAYANAIRILARPPMSPNVDNSVEQTVLFNRKVVAAANQPIGLYALPR